MTTTPTQDRDAFEAWVSDGVGRADFSRHRDGYRDSVIDAMWGGWEGRASQVAVPPQPAEQPVIFAVDLAEPGSERTLYAEFTMQPAEQAELIEVVEWLTNHLAIDHNCMHMDPASSGIPAWIDRVLAAGKRGQS